MSTIECALETPALVIDLAAFERNLQTMAKLAQAAGVSLRPHAKTHKSVEIVRMQLDAGAVGICCAKLGEAAVFVAAGVHGVLLTSPVVTPTAIHRLRLLSDRAEELMVVVDHVENARALAAAMDPSKPLRVLVDVDIGQGRTGVKTHAQALALAQEITRHSSLTLVGVQGYAGHLQHVEEASSRRALVTDAMTQLRGFVEALRRAGHPIAIVTGGGTGSVEADIAAGVLTELQTGSYVFMDTQYRLCQWSEEKTWPFEQALFVHTSVVSVHNEGWVTTDAGLKAFATDGPLPEVCEGMPIGAVYGYFGDEHGMLMVFDEASRPALGSRIVCSATHCDPTVNLYDEYHAVRGGKLVRKITVDARGRSA